MHKTKTIYTLNNIFIILSIFIANANGDSTDLYINLAPSSLVEQSSVFHGKYIFTSNNISYTKNIGFYPELSINGKVDTKGVSDPMAMTNSERNPWLLLTLKKPAYVSMVSIHKMECINNLPCNVNSNLKLYQISQINRDTKTIEWPIEKYEVLPDPESKIKVNHHRKTRAILLVSEAENTVLALSEIQILGAGSQAEDRKEERINKIYDGKNGVFLHWGPGTFSQKAWNEDYNIDKILFDPSDIENIETWGSIKKYGFDYSVCRQAS